jgi:hypothetical protein
MITFDDSSLSVEQRGKLPLYDKLEEFAMKVSLLKPMINFVVNKDCVATKHRKDGNGDVKTYICIQMLLAYENGEELGGIYTDLRYRGGDKDLVYGVSSHRISKSRGSRDSTEAKDIKVALRNVKKTLIARADDEAKSLILNQVKSKIANLYATLHNQVRWGIDTTDEAMLYARMAYLARLQGLEYVSLPVKLISIKTKKDEEQHNKAFASLEDCFTIKTLCTADRGYGIQSFVNGNLNVYNFSDKSIKRYKDFNELPEHIQSKFAMFKVLNKDEIVPTIGVKLDDDIFFVVD